MEHPQNTCWREHKSDASQKGRKLVRVCGFGLNQLPTWHGLSLVILFCFLLVFLRFSLAIVIKNLWHILWETRVFSILYIFENIGGIRYHITVLHFEVCVCIKEAQISLNRSQFVFYFLFTPEFHSIYQFKRQIFVFSYVYHPSLSLLNISSIRSRTSYDPISGPYPVYRPYVSHTVEISNTNTFFVKRQERMVNHRGRCASKGKI